MPTRKQYRSKIWGQYVRASGHPEHMVSFAATFIGKTFKNKKTSG